MAVTRVCKIVMLLLKNAMLKCTEPVFCIAWFYECCRKQILSVGIHHRLLLLSKILFLRFLLHYGFLKYVRATFHGSCSDLRENPFIHARSFLPGSKKDTSENVSFPAALFCFLFARIVEFKLIHLLHSEMASQVFLYIKGVPAVEIR